MGEASINGKAIPSSLSPHFCLPVPEEPQEEEEAEEDNMAGEYMAPSLRSPCWKPMLLLGSVRGQSVQLGTAVRGALKVDS